MSNAPEPTEHPNATAYRRAAAAFRAGDLATIEKLTDPDVVWHVLDQIQRWFYPDDMNAWNSIFSV